MPETIRKIVDVLIIAYILFCIAPAEGQETDASPNLNQLALTIKQNYYELVVDKNKYALRSQDFPEGGSRTETLELLTDDNGRKVPKVQGLLNLVYKGAPFIVTVIYQADEKGYRAKFVYGAVKPRPPIVQLASVNLLKSAAG